MSRPRPSSARPLPRWRRSVKFRPSGPAVREKRIEVAPSAPVASKIGPDGPKTTGVWAEFYRPITAVIDSMTIKITFPMISRSSTRAQRGHTPG